jgi:uroporphyrinogen-III synthase
MTQGFAFAAALLAVSAAPPAQAADALAALLRQARPVVVLGGGPKDPRFAKQMAALGAKARLVADYKVVPVPQADAALRQKLGVAAQGFAVVLVGKDGSVKETWREPVAPARIFTLIDRMPMRRDEVRGRK